MPTRYNNIIWAVISFFIATAQPVMAQSRKEYAKLTELAIKKTGERKYAEALEILEKVRTVAETRQWYGLQYSTLTNIGFTYYQMLDYGEAMNYYMEGYALAVKHLGAKEEITLLNNIANLYTKQELYDKALEYYTKAYKTASDKDIATRKGIPLMNIGYIHNRLKHPETARPYLEQSLLYFKDEPLNEASARLLIAENDFLLGNYKTARNRALSIIEKTPGAAKAGLDFFADLLVSKTYMHEGHYTEAEKYALRVLNRYIDADVRLETLKLLDDIYARSGQLQKAFIYKDSVIAAGNVVNEMRNGRQFENNRVRFEIQNYRNDIQNSEKNLRNERIIFICVLILLLATVVITILFLRQKNMAAERDRNITALNLEKEKNHSLMLEQQINNTLLEQERLKNEVEAGNHKLSAKAMYLNDRNSIIEEIVSYLSHKPKYSTDKRLSEYVRSLKNNMRTDSEYDSIVTHYEQVNHTFLNYLKEIHPLLSANDIRFIAYMCMGLSINDIASLLNITPVACKKRKERLAVKMDLSRDIDVYDYLAGLKPVA